MNILLIEEREDDSAMNDTSQTLYPYKVGKDVVQLVV